jgi:single-strand DNA-binding protein
MSKVWLNYCQISGRLGHDAELRYTSSQTPVLSFDVAVTKPANTQEHREEETTWFKCVLWGKLAETVKPLMLKGTQVYFSGEMTIRKWVDRDQKQRQSFEISNWNRWAHQLIIIQNGKQHAPGAQDDKAGSNVSKPSDPGPGDAAAPSGRSVPDIPNSSFTEEKDQDLPF